MKQNTKTDYTPFGLFFDWIILKSDYTWKIIHSQTQKIKTIAISQQLVLEHVSSLSSLDLASDLSLTLTWHDLGVSVQLNNHQFGQTTDFCWIGEVHRFRFNKEEQKFYVSFIDQPPQWRDLKTLSTSNTDEAETESSYDIRSLSDIGANSGLQFGGSWLRANQPKRVQRKLCIYLHGGPFQRKELGHSTLLSHYLGTKDIWIPNYPMDPVAFPKSPRSQTVPRTDLLKTKPWSRSFVAELAGAIALAEDQYDSIELIAHSFGVYLATELCRHLAIDELKTCNGVFDLESLIHLRPRFFQDSSESGLQKLGLENSGHQNSGNQKAIIRPKHWTHHQSLYDEVCPIEAVQESLSRLPFRPNKIHYLKTSAHDPVID